MSKIPRVQFERLQQWPRGHERTPVEERTQSRFDSSYRKTMELLERELRMIGAASVVLQLDIHEGSIRQDGLPYANARVGAEDSGVVLSFDLDDQHLMYPCDTYQSWQDNLRAIALTLQNLRAVDRYGVSKSGEQYVGWRALPADVDRAMSREEAATILVRTAGVSEEDRVDAIESLSKIGIYPDLRWIYRKAAANAHPDAGGTTAAFRRVQKAREVLERA